MEELRRELGETRFAMERLEIESRSVREVSDKRKKALDDALAKLQEKKLQVEKQAEELNKRAEDIDAVNKKYEEIQATLSQKESALRGLNSAHEQLRARFNEGQRKMEDEKWELASKLDDANSKCEEQERRMKQFVSEIENLKSAVAKVQKKCSDAEAVAEEKTKAMQRLKAELESREATISVFSDNRTHSEVFKMKLAECERSLAQESAQRASAESALEELRSKSGHLLKVEQEHNTAQEQLKWRKEQFGLLEEAHKKLQQQFQDQKDEWEGEKVGLITEISNLQINLESQCRQSKDLELQLQRCNQALAHEESRRKVLEIQAEESRYGFEKVAAEFEEARSVIESLTEKSSKEVGHLRDSLASKERQVREMEVKQTRMEQENQELKSMLDEFQAFKYGSDEMQGSLERFKMKYAAIEESYKEISETMKRKESQWDKEREEMLKTLNDCQVDVVSKDGKIYGLQNQLEGALSTVERLTYQKAELSQRLTISESEYQQAQSKLMAENLTLESSCKRKNEEVDCLKDQLQAKQKAFEQIQQELDQHQRTIEMMTGKCQSLEALEVQFLALQEEVNRKQEQFQSLSKSRDLLQHQMLQKEQSHKAEVKKVTDTFEETNACLRAKEQRENELHNELRRLQEVIDNNQAIRVTLENKTEEYQHRLQALQQEMSEASNAHSLLEEKSKAEKAALLDVIKVRDRKIEELKEQVMHFEQTLNRLSQQEESWLEMQAQHKQLLGQRTRELESLAVANAKLETVGRQLLDCEQERNILQKCLESKETDMGELQKKNEVLSAEKSAIVNSIKVHEDKISRLVEENENNNLALQQACTKLELADSKLDDRDRDIAELQQKLKQVDVLHQELSHTEKKMQQLEILLGEGRSCIQEKEEKIYEFEIAVEHLRNEVLLVKQELAEKEKDEAILGSKLTSAQRELRAKEDQLIDMESNLNDILKKSEEKQAEIDRLCDVIHEMEERATESKLCHADLEAQLKSIQAVVEGKEAALDAVRLEVQNEKDTVEDMKDIIETLKCQLRTEQKNSSDKQSEIKHLHRDLKASEMAEVRYAESLKEAEGRLLDLEQNTKDQISQLQESVTELQHEVSVTRMKMEKSEMALKSANEELLSWNEKCTTLEEIISTKDMALEAKETDISSLQSDLMKKSENIAKGQLDLQLLQERLQSQFENEQDLEKTISLFRHQVAELQECNQQLGGDLNILHRDHEVAVNELAHMKDEVDQLRKKLEQKEVEQREANSLISQIKEQLASALLTVCNQDTDILGLKNDLIVSQAQLEELIATTGSSEKIVSELLDKLQLSEDKTKVLEKQVVGLRVALEGAEGSLKEETIDMLSLCNSFDELQTLLANIKLDAKSAFREGMHYAAEFRTAMKGFQNVKVQLECFQKREKDMTSELVRLEELLKDSQFTSTMQAKQIGLLGNTVKDLNSELFEWKNKAATSVEDAEYMPSQLKNANQVKGDLQEQFDGCKSTQGGSKEVADSTMSPAYIDGLITDLKNWKAMAMSITEEITEVRLQLKHSEEIAIEQNSKIEAYKNKEHLVEKQYSMLQEEICNCYSGLSNEMDKFLLVCHSMGELEGDVLKCKEEVLINHRQLREEISAFRGELAVFEIFKGQVQSFEVKLQTVQQQLLIWKDKVAVADSQNKSLQADLEIANLSLGELRKYKEEAMEREKHLQVELSTTQESLRNLNHNFLEETGRLNSLLSSIKNMEAERNNLLEKMRSANEENSAELELEAPKTFFLQKALCQLQNLQVDEVNLRARLQRIQDRKLNWATEGDLDVKENLNHAYASCSSSIEVVDKMEMVRSADEQLPETFEAHYLNSCLNMQGEQEEQNVQGLVRELEVALTKLSGKNTLIEELNREVESLQSLVNRLEQRNSELEHKDSSTIDPERYFHYQELCDSLVRDQLRLKKKLDIAERKNQGLVEQIEEMRQLVHAKSHLEDSNKDGGLTEKQDENMIYMPKTKVQTEVASGHGSSERPPLQELNF